MQNVHKSLQRNLDNIATSAMRDMQQCAGRLDRKEAKEDRNSRILNQDHSQVSDT